MGFFQQKYWSGLSFPPPGDHLDPGIEPVSPALADRRFSTWATWEALDSTLVTSKPAHPPTWVTVCSFCWLGLIKMPCDPCSLVSAALGPSKLTPLAACYHYSLSLTWVQELTAWVDSIKFLGNQPISQKDCIHLCWDCRVSVCVRVSVWVCVCTLYTEASLSLRMSPQGHWLALHQSLSGIALIWMLPSHGHFCNVAPFLSDTWTQAQSQLIFNTGWLSFKKVILSIELLSIYLWLLLPW